MTQATKRKLRASQAEGTGGNSPNSPNPASPDDFTALITQALGAPARLDFQPSIPRPTLLVSLTTEGALCMALPGPTGVPRYVTLKPGHEAQILTRILEGQATGKYAIGSDGAPTSQQSEHWAKHSTFPDSRCPHCQAEGRFSSTKIKLTTIVRSSVQRGEITVRRLNPSSAKIVRPAQPVSEADLGI